MLPYGLLYFQVADKEGKLFPIGDPFVMTPDSIHFITPTRQPTLLDGILTYDVKRVLKLGDEPYTLLYWKDGWQPLKEVTSKDSRTLDFERYLSAHCFWYTAIHIWDICSVLSYWRMASRCTIDR